MVRKQSAGVITKSGKAFEKVSPFEDISVTMISELFEQIQMPVDMQEDFWVGVLEKMPRTLSGSISRIMTNDQDRDFVEVINDSATVEVIFSHERDMTDLQFEEFKRAQNNGSKVTVYYYQEEDGSRPVKLLHVFSRTD